jgi:hypothetical protein
MHVGVDEPGEKICALKVDTLAIPGQDDFPLRADLFDAPLLNQDDET